MYGGPSLSLDGYGTSEKETKSTERESEGEKKPFRRRKFRNHDASPFHITAEEVKKIFVPSEKERYAQQPLKQDFAGELKTFVEQLKIYSQRPGGVKLSPGGQMSMRVQPKNGPTVTDNRKYEVYQTITPSDPQQAADMALRSFGEAAQINTPGLNAAVVY